MKSQSFIEIRQCKGWINNYT